MANPKGINQYTGKAKAAVAAKVQAVKSGAKAKAAAAVGRRPATSKMPPPKPGTRVTHMPPPKPGTRVTHMPPPKPGTAVNLPAPGAKAATGRPVKSATSSPKAATAPKRAAASKAAAMPKAAIPKAAAQKAEAKSVVDATTAAKLKATTAKQKATKGPTPGSPVAVKKAQAVLLGQKADALRVGTDLINAKTTGKKPKPKAWKPKKEDKVVVPASQAPGGKAITITKFIEMKHGTGSPQHLKALATYTTNAAALNKTMRELYGPPTAAKKR